MKKISKTIRLILGTLLIIVVSQAAVLAAGNEMVPSSNELNSLQIIGGFALLLLAILLPLAKSQRKQFYRSNRRTS